MDRGPGRPRPAWERTQPWAFAEIGAMVYVDHGMPEGA